MRLFSQRKGLKPVKSIMQVDSMDDDLRNGLWNALTIFYWNQVKTVELGYGPVNQDMQSLLTKLWDEYFKQPIDTIDGVWYKTRLKIGGVFS